VLPLAIRNATKLINYVQDARKVYAGSIRLGITTDTLDAEGKVLAEYSGELPGKEEVCSALEAFHGEIQQVPPMYSAVKVGGVPLHKLAREGKEIAREPKTVRIDRMELVSFESPLAKIEVECSGGTYVRVLAADVGEKLGCGAHLSQLRRTRSGPFQESQAETPEALAKAADEGVILDRLLSPLGVLGLPALRLAPHEIRRLVRGGDLDAQGPPQAPGTVMAAHGEAGEVVAILELRPGRRLKPLRVLPSSEG
jgi:tRNA pseudouridine55 synthase